MNISLLHNIPNYERWTKSAIFCYKRGCNCRNCPIKEIVETKCKMKYSVIKLVKNIGKPKDIQERRENVLK